MDHCMKSFQIRIAQNYLLVSGSPGNSLRTWGTVGQYYWSAGFNPGSTSVYNLEGFKSVDIFGMSVNGYVKANSNSINKCAIVDDWAFSLILEGYPPLVSGFKRVSPDGFDLVTKGTTLPKYNLSKNQNSVMMADPIPSVKSITFEYIYAQGSGAEFLNEIEFQYSIMFTFYYKYEGEY